MDIAGAPAAESTETAEPILSSFMRQQQEQLVRLMSGVTELFQRLPMSPAFAAAPAETALADTSPWEPGHAPASHALLPKRYSGDLARCENFVLACDLHFAEFLTLTSTQKISTLIQRLVGGAWDWAAAVWRTNDPSARTTQVSYSVSKQTLIIQTKASQHPTAA